jgi:hypothetical protein
MRIFIDTQDPALPQPVRIMRDTNAWAQAGIKDLILWSADLLPDDVLEKSRVGLRDAHLHPVRDSRPHPFGGYGATDAQNVPQLTLYVPQLDWKGVRLKWTELPHDQDVLEGLQRDYDAGVSLMTWEEAVVFGASKGFRSIWQTVNPAWSTRKTATKLLRDMLLRARLSVEAYRNERMYGKEITRRKKEEPKEKPISFRQLGPMEARFATIMFDEQEVNDG